MLTSLRATNEQSGRSSFSAIHSLPATRWHLALREPIRQSAGRNGRTSRKASRSRSKRHSVSRDRPARKHRLPRRFSLVAALAVASSSPWLPTPQARRLTLPSSGHTTAVRFRPSFHSGPYAACRCVPLMSNVGLNKHRNDRSPLTCWPCSNGPLDCTCCLPYLP